MKRLFVLLAALTLTACSLADMAGAPPQLYELKVAPVEVAGKKPVRAQMLVALPEASAGIDTTRIALVQKDGVLSFYKDVSWTGRTSDMMQSLLLQAFEKEVPATGRDNTGLRADYLLQSDLRQFAMNETTGAVTVELQVKLVALPKRDIIATRTFVAEEASEGRGLVAVVAAYQRASERVLTDIVRWSVEKLHK